jgi:hypothetical protein
VRHSSRCTCLRSRRESYASKFDVRAVSNIYVKLQVEPQLEPRMLDSDYVCCAAAASLVAISGHLSQQESDFLRLTPWGSFSRF